MAALALTYRRQGRWEEAENLEARVMETSKTKLGPNRRDTSTSINNFGQLRESDIRFDGSHSPPSIASVELDKIRDPKRQ